MQINPVSQLYRDFMTILDQTVVKYSTIADNNETLDIKKEADLFVNAYYKEDTFFTYYRYEKSIIAEVMNIIDEEEILGYHLDRNSIPAKYRDMMLKKQREFIIDNYVEKNNYYRMLNGKPDIGESSEDYIYVPVEKCMMFDIDPMKPIHEMTDTEISSLNSVGYIDQVIKENPSKKYLNFLGNKKIDILTARRARNFSLLRIPAGISEALWSNFALIYEQCREYFMTCIYINEYRNIIDYYDNFIALCIMVMAMQQIISRTIKSVIDRDFFDEYCIRQLFSVYSLPYNSKMDSNTRKQIVQSLNLLIQNKGTNKAIYDIASILGYNRLNVYKYYLMKTQKFDEKGLPVVKYKKNYITGEDEFDYEKMFDVYFQKAKINDLDTYKNLIVKSNKVSYEEVTQEDPYWIEDDDLYKELYESEYNFIETKYMGVSISYRMTKILFENIYLLRLIFDKKNEIPHIQLELPRIKLYGSIPLFDAIVTLCAMTCKQNRLRGEILVNPSMILHVMGFNFSEDFELIKQEILNDENLDNSLCDFFKDSTVYTAAQLNDLYVNYLDLYDVLVDKMSTTQDKDVYQAYMKLYKTIFYSKESKRMFNLGDEANPKYAETFMDYLKYAQPDIYEFIEGTDPDQMYIYTNHIAYKVSSIIPNLKYLGIFSDTSSTMEAMLMELIRFIKSYTTDMLGLEVIYILDLKPESMIRLIDYMIIHKTIEANDKVAMSYTDHLTFTANVMYKSNIDFIDKIKSITAALILYDSKKFLDKISLITANIDAKSELLYVDVVNELVSSIDTSSKMIFNDIAKTYSQLHLHDKCSFNDVVKAISTIFRVNEGFIIFDDIESESTIFDNDKLSYIDNFKMRIQDMIKTYIEFKDEVDSMSAKLSTSNSILSLFEDSEIKSFIEDKDNIYFRETYKITYN